MRRAPRCERPAPASAREKGSGAKARRASSAVLRFSSLRVGVRKGDGSPFVWQWRARPPESRVSACSDTAAHCGLSTRLDPNSATTVIGRLPAHPLRWGTVGQPQRAPPCLDRTGIRTRRDNRRRRTQSHATRPMPMLRLLLAVAYEGRNAKASEENGAKLCPKQSQHSGAGSTSKPASPPSVLSRCTAFLVLAQWCE